MSTVSPNMVGGKLQVTGTLLTYLLLRTQRIDWLGGSGDLTTAFLFAAIATAVEVALHIFVALSIGVWANVWYTPSIVKREVSVRTLTPSIVVAGFLSIVGIIALEGMIGAFERMIGKHKIAILF